MIEIKKMDMELDDDILGTVAGGAYRTNSRCYYPGDNLSFKDNCPACGQICTDQLGFIATVEERFQCDGQRDMVKIKVGHCGGIVVRWVDHK